MITPFSNEQCQPASYDCLLDNDFIFEEGAGPKEVINIVEGAEKLKVSVSDFIIIPPHTMVLGSTVEWFRLPLNICMYVEGKSSIGRSGLFIQNAGFVDPGFHGNITLEMYNANNYFLKIPVGIPICQVVCLQVKGVIKGYNGKYVQQKGVTASRLYKDFQDGRD
jgi:dCTP deaminase